MQSVINAARELASDSMIVSYNILCMYTYMWQSQVENTLYLA